MMKSAIGVVVILIIDFTLCNAECGKVFGSGVSEIDKEAIMERHNHYLKLFQTGYSDQPEVKNVYPLTWNGKLAEEAQKVANTCKFNYDSVDNDKFGNVGQNRFSETTSSPTSGANWYLAVNSWYEQHENSIYSREKRSLTKNYVQPVWADTKKIGCGFKWFNEGSDTKSRKLYVCSYGTGYDYPENRDISN